VPSHLPHEFNLNIMEDEKEMVYALPVTQFKYGDATGKLTKIDEIKTVQSISWG
jgi:hypothetical protein